MYRFFTIYLDNKQTVSPSLMDMLGYLNYEGAWHAVYTNSADVDEALRVFTELGYKWVMEYEYFNEKKRFDNLEAWSEWYDN